MEIIKISDKKIVEFYKSHPELNVVTMNLIFIDIIEKLSSNLHTSVENTVSQQILGLVSDMRSEIKQLNTGLSARLAEVKREYIDDVKLLMSNSELVMHDKLTHSIERNLDAFVAKTTVAINDVLPAKNAGLVEEIVKKHTDRIMADTAALISPENKTEKDKGAKLDQLETSLNTMIAHLANTNAAAMQGLQERLVASKQSQDTMFSELGSFLNKYKNNSSVKGAVSETELYHMLQQIEPYAEIVNCSGETATCDFRMRRLNASKPVILFESKDYAASVNTEEVAKFERDLQQQKCHGIFVSQNSPITFKENFHIDIISGIIHVYVSNVKYNCDIVKTAISIVDHLAAALPNGGSSDDSREDTHVNVSIKDIELMKIECSTFAAKRLRIIESVRAFSKDMLEQLEDIQLPTIRRITGADSGVNGLPCTICNNFWGKNQSSLSAHKRRCAKEHGFVRNLRFGQQSCPAVSEAHLDGTSLVPPAENEIINSINPDCQGGQSLTNARPTGEGWSLTNARPTGEGWSLTGIEDTRTPPNYQEGPVNATPGDSTMDSQKPNKVIRANRKIKTPNI